MRMKKLFCMLLVALWVLASCKPAGERYVDELKSFVEKIVAEGDEYTSEKWEEVNRQYDELMKKAEQLKDLTDEQKEEIARLRGKYSGTVVKKGFDSLMDKAGETLNEAGNAIGGFLEGLGSDKDDSKKDEQSGEEAESDKGKTIL